MRKKYLLILYFIGAAIILLLITTNPTLKDFKENTGFAVVKDSDYPNYIDPHYISRRDHNFFVCSTYSYCNLEYLGIAGNFFMTKVLPGKHTIISQGGEVKFDGFVQDSSAVKP